MTPIILFHSFHIFCQINFFKSLQTKQMRVVHQNIMSSIMLKNDKLFNGNVRLHLTTQTYRDILAISSCFWEIFAKQMLIFLMFEFAKMYSPQNASKMWGFNLTCAKKVHFSRPGLMYIKYFEANLILFFFLQVINIQFI